MIAGIEVEHKYIRSSDGEDEEKRGGWDVGASVIEVKRESTLAIEKQIRETLEAIGRHKDVKAFPVGGNTQVDVNIAVVTAAQARELSAAQKRLSRYLASHPAEANVISNGGQGI